MRRKNLLFLIGAFLLGFGCVAIYLKASVMTTEEAIKRLQEYDIQYLGNISSSEEGEIKIISKDLLDHFKLYQEGKEGINDYPYIDTIIKQYIKKVLLKKEFTDIKTQIGKTAQQNEKDAFRGLPVRCLEAFVAEGCLVRNCVGLILNIGKATLRDEKLLVFVLQQGITELYPELISYRYRGPNATVLTMVAGISLTPEPCEILIAAGADVNAKDNNGMTPLMLAAQSSTVEICKALIKGGADVNTENNKGYSALTIASYSGNDDIVALLLRNGADAKSINKSRAMVLTIMNNIFLMNEIMEDMSKDKFSNAKFNYQEVLRLLNEKTN